MDFACVLNSQAYLEMDTLGMYFRHQVLFQKQAGAETHGQQGRRRGSPHRKST